MSFSARHGRFVLFLASIACGPSCAVYDASLLPDDPEDASTADASADRRADTSAPTCDGAATCAIDAGSDGAAEASSDASFADAPIDATDANRANDRGGSGDAPVDAGNRIDVVETGAADASDAADARVDVVIDNCPTDPAKTDPGRCGCGTPETDSDSDGTPNCVDACPADPLKTQAGVCGCGKQEPPTGAGAAFCFKDRIVHRYNFSGTGTVATDSVGSANGAIVGGSRDASQSGGSLTLSGDQGTGYNGEGYVALPSNLLSGLTSATFEAWVTWSGAANTGTAVWQRIFDFGDQTGNGNSAVGRTYFFLTPSAAQAGGPLRATFSNNALAGEILVNASTGTLPTGTRKHVAVVIDDANNMMSIYLDGAVVGFVQLTPTLSTIGGTNAWLGRSQYAVDPEFNGTLHEFRIYNSALSATEVSQSFAAGPDPTYLP